MSGQIFNEEPISHKDIDFNQTLYFAGMVDNRVSVYKIRAEGFTIGEVQYNGVSYNIRALHSSKESLLKTLSNLLDGIDLP